MALTVPSVLAAGHVLEEFDCGKASFYDWLVRHARQSQSCGPAKTYVVADEQRVVGYFSLTVGQIDTLEAPDRVRKGMGRIPCPLSFWRGWLSTSICMARYWRGASVGSNPAHGHHLRASWRAGHADASDR